MVKYCITVGCSNTYKDCSVSLRIPLSGSVGLKKYDGRAQAGVEA